VGLLGWLLKVLKAQEAMGVYSGVAEEIAGPFLSLFLQYMLS